MKLGIGAKTLRFVGTVLRPIVVNNWEDGYASGESLETPNV